MVKKEQQLITTTGDHDHFEALAISDLAFWNCYQYLIFDGKTRDYTSRDILNNMLYNTPERLKKELQNSRTALPFAFEVSNPESCNNPIVKGQY
jgi:hypothetical protein